MVDSVPITTIPADKHNSVQQAQRIAAAGPAVDQIGDQSARRRSSTQNKPGIQVTLDSLEQNPQIDEYRSLHSDGRRKDETKVEDSRQTADAVTIDIGTSDSTSNQRSVNPRSKLILDSFIEQMGGAELSQTTGNFVKTFI